MNLPANAARRLADSAFVKAFSSWRVGVMLPLGFAAGMPLLLSGDTLSAWLRSEGVDLTTIGVFALVSIPYNLKFLWAPLLDRFRLPWLGRRRGWIALSQILLIAAIGTMGTIDPARRTLALAAMAMVVAFLGASQDIVVDAYRTDVLPPVERASGVAVYVAAYRVALIVASAGALILSDLVAWTIVYWAMAALMSVGIVGTLFAPDPVDAPDPPNSLRESVVNPFVDFFRRKDAIVMFAIVLTYKVGDAVLSHLKTPFLMDLGFPRSEIGAIAKGFGLAATIVGALVGGGLVAKWGLRWSLIIFGVLQASANVFFIALAHVGAHHGLLVAAIGVDSLFGGLGTAAFVAFVMSLCNRRFTAFQYALLSSSWSVLGRTLGAGSGWIAANAGWDVFFVVTIVVALPALVLLYRHEIPEEAPDA